MDPANFFKFFTIPGKYRFQFFLPADFLSGYYVFAEFLEEIYRFKLLIIPSGNILF